MLAAIVRASLRNPRIVTALACLIAALGVAAVIAARFDVFPDFAPPHVLVQTEAPGLDATQVEALVTQTLGSAAGRHRKCQDAAFDVEPGPLGDPGGVRPRRRSLSPAPSRHRTPGGIRRPASAGGRSAAVVAAEFLDGIPRAFRLHQRPAVAGGTARRGAVDRQAADPRGARSGAGADFRRRSARTADRNRPGQTSRGRARSRRCPGHREARDRLDRRRLPRNAYAAHRDPGAGAGRHGCRRWRRPWSVHATDLRCVSATSPRCAKAPRRDSATP